MNENTTTEQSDHRDIVVARAQPSSARVTIREVLGVRSNGPRRTATQIALGGLTVAVLTLSSVMIQDLLTPAQHDEAHALWIAAREQKQTVDSQPKVATSEPAPPVTSPAVTPALPVAQNLAVPRAGTAASAASTSVATPAAAPPTASIPPPPTTPSENSTPIVTVVVTTVTTAPSTPTTTTLALVASSPPVSVADDHGGSSGSGSDNSGSGSDNSGSGSDNSGSGSGGGSDNSGSGSGSGGSGGGGGGHG